MAAAEEEDALDSHPNEDHVILLAIFYDPKLTRPVNQDLFRGRS